MKDIHSIEQQLIAAGEGKSTNQTFVKRTMEKITAANAGTAFNAVFAPPAPVSLFQRYLRLPKYAMLAIAFGACALVSGTAYAAYSLWLSPSAQVRSVESKYGRDQALISLKNCSGSLPDVTVEITKGSKGTPEGAADSQFARCELQAAQEWAIKTFHVEVNDVLFPLRATKVADQSLSLIASGVTERSYHIDKDTPVIYKGHAIPLSDIHVGDAIAIIRSNNIKAVIKLSLPIKYYASDEINNNYHDRYTCYGNAPASCINLPNLDVLRSGEGGSNADYHGTEAYEIQGKLISYTPTDILIEATDGTRYTVHTDINPIGILNAGNPYSTDVPVIIEPGDVLMVRYEQMEGDNPKNIQSYQYHIIQLMLQGFSKSNSNEQNNAKYHYE